MRRKMKRMTAARTVTLCAVAALALSGCGRGDLSVVVIEQDPYQPASEYQTTVVQRGDFVPEFEMSLRVDGFDTIQYSVSTQDLVVNTLYVWVGDKVQEGDLLVSFQSENLEAVIAGYEDQCRQNELLVDHYRKLMRADSSLDYSRDIEMIQQDITLARMYQEEAKKKLEGYQIVASAPGTITKVNEYLTGGILDGTRNLITEVTGTGNYTGTTAQQYEFKVGEVYTARMDVVDYELAVAEVSWAENKHGIMEQTVIFKPISDTSALSDADKLSLVVQKPKLTDVVYLDAGYVHETDGRYFVYVLGEDGFRRAVFVTVGEMVMGNLIITSGLSGGEKVTKN